MTIATQPLITDEGYGTQNYQAEALSSELNIKQQDERCGSPSFAEQAPPDSTVETASGIKAPEAYQDSDREVRELPSVPLEASVDHQPTFSPPSTPQNENLPRTLKRKYGSLVDSSMSGSDPEEPTPGTEDLGQKRKLSINISEQPSGNQCSPSDSDILELAESREPEVLNPEADIDFDNLQTGVATEDSIIVSPLPSQSELNLPENSSQPDVSHSSAVSTSSQLPSQPPSSLPTVSGPSQEYENSTQPTEIASSTPATSMLDSMSSVLVQSDQMTASDMFECLLQHGCKDLTPLINATKYSGCRVAEGGFGDIWKGELTAGTSVAVKVLRFALVKDGGRKSLKCYQIATGVEYVHSKRMVHGDIKASNILVSPNGVLKLTDFDHSLISEWSLVFTDTTRIGGGSVRWMAPELVMETTHQRSKKADIYALGMTFLEIFTGLPPYYPQCRNEPQVIAKVMKKVLPERPLEHIAKNHAGNEMWFLLNRCWKYDPIYRPNAQELLAALRRSFPSSCSAISGRSL